MKEAKTAEEGPPALSFLVWARHRGRCPDESVLDPNYPLEDVRQSLRDAGGDPDAIARRGEALVARLLEGRRQTRTDETA